MKGDLTREQELMLEEQALQTLLQLGVKFSVPLKIKPKPIPKRIELWNKLFPNKPKVWRDRRIPKEWDVEIKEVYNEKGDLEPLYLRKFYIKPLYLGTIDLIRLCAIEVDFEEAKLQGETAIESSRLMKYVPVMAKIAAIAVLNCSDITDPTYKKVKELQNFFLAHLTSARLQKISLIILQMSDKAGFIASIRSTMLVGTTAPKAIRVE